MDNNKIKIDEIVDNLIECAGGEDVFIGIMAEFADECLRKMSADKIWKLYRDAGNDGCNLMEINYFRHISESYN